MKTAPKEGWFKIEGFVSKEFTAFLKTNAKYSDGVFDGSNTVGTVHNWFAAVESEVRARMSWAPRNYFANLSEHDQRYTLFLKDNLFQDNLPPRYRQNGRMAQTVAEYDSSIVTYKALRDKFGQALCYRVMNLCVSKAMLPVIEKRLDARFPDRALEEQTVGTMADFLALQDILSENALTLPPSLFPEFCQPVCPEVASNPVLGSTLRLFGALRRESARLALLLRGTAEPPDDPTVPWISYNEYLAVINRGVLFRHLGGAVSRNFLSELRNAGLVLSTDPDGQLIVSFDIPIPANDTNNVVARVDVAVHAQSTTMVAEAELVESRRKSNPASKGESRQRAKAKPQGEGRPSPQKRTADVLTATEAGPKKRPGKRSPRTSSRDISTIQCYNCGEMGHYSTSCEAGKGPKCAKCKRSHVSTECLAKPARTPGKSGSGTTTKKGRGANK